MAGRQDYEDRRQARIDRLNDAADKASKESNAAITRSYNLTKDIPLGQPNINGALTGVMNKSRNAADRAVKLNKKAGYYANRAESAESNTTISADDPNAPDKLREKLAKLEQYQKEMKAANAYWRKHKTMKGCPGWSDENAAAVDKSMETAYSWVQKNGPCEDWKLSNNNATIRATKKRLEGIERVDAMPAEIIQFDGGEIDSNAYTNRVIIRFDERQDEETTAKLKSNGFRWAPSEKGWQRLRNPWALRIAKRIVGLE